MKIATALYQFGFREVIKRIVRGKTYRMQGMGFVYSRLHGRSRCRDFFKEIKDYNRLYIVFDHDFGGGATSYLNGRLMKLPNTDLFFVIRPTGNAGCLKLETHRGGSSVVLSSCLIEKIDDLVDMIQHEFKSSIYMKIIINELVHWWSYYQVFKECDQQVNLLVEMFIKLKAVLSAEMLYLCHDYYPICPRIRLTTTDGNYCNSEVDQHKCNFCLYTSNNQEGTWPNVNIKNWRSAFTRLFAACDEVRTFSQDSHERFSRCFPNTIFSLIPHECTTIFPERPNLRLEGITIGVFGTITVWKGALKVIELADYLANIGRKDVKIVVVGELVGIDVSSCLKESIKVLGKYQKKLLCNIIEEEGINVAFFSSVCPETFSFVTQELEMLNLPIVCFPIGAPQDRIRKYAKGIVTRDFAIESVWSAIKQLTGA